MILFLAFNDILIYQKMIITNVKYISNAMCYTMLYMLEWMRKEKHRIGTSKTWGLHDLALTAYIHGEIP